LVIPLSRSQAKGPETHSRWPRLGTLSAGPEVRIGETGNLVRLTSAEWNVLVRAIKAGELKEI